MNEVLYILTREHEIDKIKNKKNICFSLSPMIKNVHKMHIIYPDPLITCKIASKQVRDCNRVLSRITDLVNESIDNKESEFSEEILIPYLDVKISIYLYLKNILPKSKCYKLHLQGKWVDFYKLSDLIISLEKKYSKEEGNIHNQLLKFTKTKNNILLKLISTLQIFLINKIIHKNSVYLLSNNKSYFMPTIFSELKKRRKNVIVFNPSQKINIVLMILLKQIISVVLNKRKIINEFFLIPSFNTKIISLKKNINLNELVDKDYLNYLINDVERYINVNYGYQSYTHRLFKKCERNQIVGVFHSNRFPDLNSLSFNLNNLKQQQHLISHGTHTLQKSDKSGLLSSESLAVGMIKSRIPNINIYSQSKFSDDYLTSQNLVFKKINPINLKIMERVTDLNQFSILSAATVKQLGSRRHYFESCFEYIYCILDLSEKLRNLDFDIKLILRIRDVNNEINSRIKRAIADKYNDIIQISEAKNISDDICKSDCLIALSSTTLEDAINHNIPSMSYGLSKYDHFSYYQNSKFKITKRMKNYSKLRKIEKLLNKDFIYFDKSYLERKNNIFDFII